MDKEILFKHIRKGEVMLWLVLGCRGTSAT